MSVHYGSFKEMYSVMRKGSTPFELTKAKKNSKGVVAIKLGKGDVLRDVYLMGVDPLDIKVSGKMLSLNRLKLANRAGKGTKH